VRSSRLMGHLEVVRPDVPAARRGAAHASEPGRPVPHSKNAPAASAGATQAGSFYSPREGPRRRPTAAARAGGRHPRRPSAPSAPAGPARAAHATGLAAELGAGSNFKPAFGMTFPPPERTPSRRLVCKLGG
jgi:hypothetical protein